MRCSIDNIFGDDDIDRCFHHEGEVQNNNQPQKWSRMSDDDEDSDASIKRIEQQWNEAKRKRDEKRRAAAAADSSTSDEEEQSPLASKVVVVDGASSPVTPAANKSTVSKNTPSRSATSKKKKKKKKKNDDKPDTPPPQPITEPQCQAIYSKDDCKKKPFVVCIGLETKGEDGVTRPLGDLDIDPHANMKKKSNCKPVSDDVLKELYRRCDVLGMVRPNANSWKKHQLLKWLKDHPTTNETDVEHLKAQEFTFCAALIDYTKQKQAESTSADSHKLHWRSDGPWRRLYHCAADDRAKPALLVLLRAKDHQESDGRHSERRPQTHHEVVADLYNDALNEHWTVVLGDPHSDFSVSVLLRLCDMPGGEENGKITPEDVKERLGDSNCQLEKIVANWEKSGKGQGSLRDDISSSDNADDEEEEESSNTSTEGNDKSNLPRNYGRLTDELAHEVGDKRSDFLHGMATHVLYYWELCDRQDIIRTALVSMSKMTSLSSRNPATTAAGAQNPRNKGKKGSNNNEESAGDEAAAAIGDAMGNLSYDTCTENLTNHRKQLLDLRLNKLRAPTDEKSPCDEPIKELESSVSELQQRQQELKNRLKQYTL